MRRAEKHFQKSGRKGKRGVVGGIRGSHCRERRTLGTRKVDCRLRGQEGDCGAPTVDEKTKQRGREGTWMTELGEGDGGVNRLDQS